MTRMMAKVCGLTHTTDLARAQAVGADLLGFVFHPESPRHCQDLLQLAPQAGDRGVLVTVADTLAPILALLAQTPLQRVQPYLPADVRAAAVHELRAAGYQVLLPWYDAPDQPHIDAELYIWETAQGDTGVHGGSGQAHSGRYPPPGPFLLAGGMSAETVAARADALDPIARSALRGFDAASRLESTPGRKDLDRLNAFVNEVHRYAV